MAEERPARRRRRQAVAQPDPQGAQPQPLEEVGRISPREAIRPAWRQMTEELRPVRQPDEAVSPAPRREEAAKTERQMTGEIRPVWRQTTEELRPVRQPREEEPIRIVAADEEKPAWMVTAGNVSGAASRRVSGRRAAEEDKGRAATPVKKKAAVPKATVVPKASTATKPSAAPKAPAEPKAPAAPKAQTRRAGQRTIAVQRSSRKARERRAQQARRTAATVLGALVLVALVVVATMGGGRLVDIKRTLDRGDGVFYPNIFVNNIPLEGKTLDEAASSVTQMVVSQISSWRITLRTQDGRSWDITGADLNMQYDVADQLDQLWAIGHSGSSSARYEQVKALEENPVMRYTTLTYDLTKVTQILTQIKREVDTPAVSATRVADDTKWPPFSYTDDVPGKELDISGLNEQICGMVDRLESGEVYLTPTPVQAAITKQYLQSQIVELATYDTTVGATSQPGRFINIRVGTEKFNHLTIKPGENVSFNKVTGLRTLENGYAVAPELAYGDYREGVGGGICQVSSTLYNAVVNAGLQVKTRTQHSLASSYVPLGLDATVQDNRLDFVFVNNTGYDIYISSEYYKKGNYYHCSFTIHGRPDPNGYSYKLESTVVQEIPVPEVTYVPDTDAQYVVYDDEEYVYTKGEKGYIVEVYLVTMDKKGMEVNRVLDHTDTYNARTPQTYVGVTPRETPVPNGYYGY